MSDIVIQPTVLGDIPGLRRILDQTELFPSDMLPDMLAPSLAGETEAFWLTCHLADEPVGFCYATPEDLTDGTWNLLALAVRPDVQGKRLGAALVAAAEQRLRDQGQRLLIVETSGVEAFAGVRRFYGRIGYAAVACIPDFWAAGDDKVIFSKTL